MLSAGTYVDLYKWSRDWLILLNVDKRKFLYQNNKNRKVSCDTEFVKSDCGCCRDLGVLVSPGFSWSNHVVHVSKSANSMLFLLSKFSFYKSNFMVFLKL